MAKKGARNVLTMACVDCKGQNYVTEKNKKNDPKEILLSKFCKTCKKVTEHKEKKK